MNMIIDAYRKLSVTQNLLPEEEFCVSARSARYTDTDTERQRERVIEKERGT